MRVRHNKIDYKAAIDNIIQFPSPVKYTPRQKEIIKLFSKTLDSDESWVKKRIIMRRLK